MTADVPLLDHHARTLETLTVPNLLMLRILHEPSVKTQVHAHERACFSFVVTGHFEERFGARTLACTPGTVLFRPAFEPHRDAFGATGSEALVLEVAPDWLAHVQEHTGVLDRPRAHDDAKTAAIAFALLSQLHHADDIASIAIEGLMLELAAQFARSSDVAVRPVPPRWLQNARKLLDERYAEGLTLSAIGTAVGVHPVHLARTFRRYHGCTIAQYVRKERIERACRALVASGAPIAQVAVETGFAHQSHLTRVFKSSTGMSPGAYRRLHRLRSFGAQTFRA